jgi:hypothetical protein
MGKKSRRTRHRYNLRSSTAYAHVNLFDVAEPALRQAQRRTRGAKRTVDFLNPFIVPERIIEKKDMRPTYRAYKTFNAGRTSYPLELLTAIHPAKKKVNLVLLDPSSKAAQQYMSDATASGAAPAWKPETSDDRMNDIYQISNALQLSVQKHIEEHSLSGSDMLQLTFETKSDESYSTHCTHSTTMVAIRQALTDWHAWSQQMFKYMYGYIASDPSETVFHITHVKSFSGSGFYKAFDLESMLSTQKKSVYTLKNADNYCFVYSLMFLQRLDVKNETGSNNRMRAMKACLERGKAKGLGMLRKEAEAIYARADVPPGPVSLSDYHKFEEIVGKRIVIFNFDQSMHPYATPYDESPYKEDYYILLAQGHYNPILKPAAMFSKRFFCRCCLKPCKDKKQHHCEGYSICKMCLSLNCGRTESNTVCPDCNRACNSTECLSKHRGSKICESIHLCTNCNIEFSTKEPHTCHERHCKRCYATYDQRHGFHRCFLPRKEDFTTAELRYLNTKKEHKANPLTELTDDLIRPRTLIVFDTESILNPTKYDYYGVVDKKGIKGVRKEVAADSSYEHLPGLVVACKVQHNPARFTPISESDYHVFDIRDHDDPMQAFCRWLFSNDHRGAKVFAHNLKGYDGQFILSYCQANNIKFSTIGGATKVMQIYIPDLALTFVDSLNYFNCALAALPKQFDLETEKGYFPYYAYHTDRLNVVVKLKNIPIDDFGLDDMSPGKAAKVRAWIAENGEMDYDIAEECLKYCKDDVKILTCALQKFSNSVFHESDRRIYAFDSLTVASMALNEYRTCFHQEGKIALDLNAVSKHTSVKEFIWLNSLKNPNIRHSVNIDIGSKRIEVDGYDSTTKTAYEFQGCVYHGCPKCTRAERRVPNKGKTYGDLYAETQLRNRLIRDKGYNLVEMWECDYDADLELRKFDREYREEHEDDIAEREGVDLRDGFKGGRTDLCKMLYHADVGNGEELKYLDYTSLYPTIMFGESESWQSGPSDRGREQSSQSGPSDRGREQSSQSGPSDRGRDTVEDGVEKWAWEINRYPIPVGYPTRLQGNLGTDISKYFGMAKVKLVPPRDLYHPVLGEKRVPPTRDAEAAKAPKAAPKLLFALDKPIIGTFTTPGIEAAVHFGYKLEKIYSVLHFDEASCDLFKEYVRYHLKRKQEASNWSVGMTKEEIVEYCRVYEEKYGLKLDPEKCVYNPAARTLHKAYLNSLYGKWAQRNMRSETRVLHTHAEFLELLIDPEVELTDTPRFIGHKYTDEEGNEQVRETVHVFYRTKEEYTADPSHTNLVVAAFITSYARLKLYSLLNYLDRRVLYYDTDSVIFTSTPEQAPTDPKLGEGLGELTNEVEKWQKITDFVAIAPKTYAYKTIGVNPATGKEETDCKIKMKGFTLNSANHKKFTFETFEEMAKNEQKSVSHVFNQFTIEKCHRTITTKPLNKKLSNVYDKRVVLPFDTDSKMIDTVPYGYVP